MTVTEQPLLPAAEQARALAAEHAAGMIPVPVEDIARALGAEVIPHRHHGPESAFVLRHDRGMILGFNSGTSAWRQRTAIAHAIWHLLRHQRDLVICRAVQLGADGELGAVASRAEEAEANLFAAELLMPCGEVLSAVGEFKAPAAVVFPRKELTDALSRKFGVGAEFAVFRLVSLGVLTS